MSDKPNSLPTFSIGNTTTNKGSDLPDQTTPSTKTSNIFGSGTASSSVAPTSNIFGTLGAKSVPQPSSLFGGSTSTGQSGSFFGGAGAGNGSGSGGSSTSGTSVFSLNKSASSQPSSSVGGLFGSATQSNPSEAPGLSQPRSNNAFGAVKTTGTSSLFGALGSHTTSSSQGGPYTPSTTAAGGKFSFANASTTPAGPHPSESPSTGRGGGTAPAFSFSKPPEQMNSPFSTQVSVQSSAAAAPGNLAASNPFEGVNQSSSNVFDNANTASSVAPTPGSIFSNPTKNSGSSVFSINTSSQPPQSSSNLFGNLRKPSETSPAGSSASNTTSPAASGGFFPKQQEGSATKTSNLFSGFGGQNADSAAAIKPSTKPLLGSLNTPNPSASAAKPTLSFSAASTEVSSLAPPTSATSTTDPTSSNALNNNGAASGSGKSVGTPAPASGLFPSLNSKATDKAPSTSESPSVVKKPNAPSTSTTSTPTLGLFGQSINQTTGSSERQPSAQPPIANVTANTQGTTANLASSNAGTVPATQSRLNNKSMDEIITRWASDLSKYQKEFQHQAEKVAKWDQMLVENSEKIQKLYGSTLEAERATSEVERQLLAVENNQDELAFWLDKYEADVDSVIANALGYGDGLSAPDQERERTYKLAEKVTERLDEMGRDLTSMIEEINNASLALSKTSKADDPLSQIVRVLNSHLSQLQQIDQGAAALQAKVVSAQKSGQSFGSTIGFNVLNSNPADDFYRSYMGRR